MNYEQFVTMAGDSAKRERYEWEGKQYVKKEVGPFLELKWAVAGADGGDCYDGDAKEWTRTKPPPDFVAVDELLEKALPGISYLAYKNLMRSLADLWDWDSDEGREYYGNYTEYKIKRMDLRRLYDHLTERGLLETKTDAGHPDSGLARQR